MYIRLCEGFTKAQMVKSLSEAHKIASKKPNSDWYYSTYYFNDKHYEKFKKTKSVKGVRDVTTSALWWDIDCEKDTDKARKTTLTIIHRLLERGFKEDNIQIRFSGNKGYHIWVNTDTEFTPKEVENIAANISGDLDGFDTSMYDATQILRLPLTKNKKSGLFCRPLKLSDLESLTDDEIRDSAKDVSEIDFKDVEAYYGVAKVPDSIMVLKDQVIETKTVDTELLQFDVKKIDYTKKPSFLNNAEWALQQGYFRGSEAAAETGDVGERDNGFLCLAAVYKKKGFDKISTYHLLKGVAELQASRTGEERFPNEDIWKKVETVYDPEWNNGKHRIWLEEKYAAKYNIPIVNYNTDTKIVGIKEGFQNFIDYAKDIDEYRFEFGIPELDEKMKARTGYLIGMLAPPSIGKCLSYDTGVLMYDGSIKKVQDIVVGDIIMGDDSTPRNILSLARGKETMYKIHTDDGSYTVNESHILSLKLTQDGQYKGLSKGDVINISVKEYLTMSDHFKRRTMGYRNAINFKEQKTEFPSYLVGLYIGDGTRGKPEITNPEPKIRNYLANLCEDSEFTLTTYEESGKAKCPRHNIVTKGKQNNPFLDFSKQFKDGKFIPKEYLINSKEKRKELLAGLIDTDGHHSSKQGCYEYTCKEKELAKDVRFLCRSLGYKCTMNEVQKSCQNNFTGTYYRLYIKGDLSDVPFLLDKSKQTNFKNQRNPEWYRIKVEKLEEDNYYGFEIDGNRLFVLDDLTVTHNTSFLVTAINNTSKLGKRSIVFSYDMAESVLFQKLIQRETSLPEDTIFKTIVDATKSNDKKAQYKVKEWCKLLDNNYGNCTFVFKSGQTINEIKQTIMEAELALGDSIPFITIDYSELVHSQFSDPTQASAEVIQGLREIANEMNKLVLVLMQPNKMNSTPTEPLLTYNCAKGSSAIAQAVTMMITAHRPGFSSTNPENDRFFAINCVKNRMGPLFEHAFSWDGPTGKIGVLSDSERQFLEQLRDMNKEDKEEQTKKKKFKDF